MKILPAPLVTRLLVAQFQANNLLARISEIEADTFTPAKEQNSQIQKIREEITKVAEEIDNIKKEITLLDARQAN